MQQIQQQTTQAGYIAAATIADVWASPGGYYNVQAGAAYMELQYAPPGQGVGGLTWTNEVLVPVGTGNLTNGTTGVRFRDAGSSSGPAVVTAALSAEAEPLIVVGAPGNLTLATGGTVTGIVNADGTFQGSGFSVAWTATTHSFCQVTFSTPFSVTPVVVAAPNVDYGASFFVLNPATTGFKFLVYDNAAVQFSFLAQPVV